MSKVVNVNHSRIARFTQQLSHLNVNSRDFNIVNDHEFPGIKIERNWPWSALDSRERIDFFIKSRII